MASIFLSGSKRVKIRSIARQAFINGRKLGKTKDQIIADATADIKQEYGTGIIAMILLGVAVKLVVDFITKWIQDYFTSDPPEEYQANEPGFSKYY